MFQLIACLLKSLLSDRTALRDHDAIFHNPHFVKRIKNMDLSKETLLIHGKLNLRRKAGLFQSHKLVDCITSTGVRPEPGWNLIRTIP